MADPEEYESEKKAELQEELEERGLPTSGNKGDLIARLEEDDASQQVEGRDVPEGEKLSIELLTAPAHGGGLAQPYVGPQTIHQKELPKNLSAAEVAKVPPGKVTGSTVNDWSRSPGAGWSLGMLPDVPPATRQAIGQ